jgi:antibiotic biosynthesis monooxygenase (ABM) superfamily enzyme
MLIVLNTLPGSEGIFYEGIEEVNGITTDFPGHTKTEQKVFS